MRARAAPKFELSMPANPTTPNNHDDDTVGLLAYERLPQAVGFETCPLQTPRKPVPQALGNSSATRCFPPRDLDVAFL
jgi:hypothetical protein